MMTPDELLSRLKTNFDVLCFVDLEEVNKSHSKVYQIFNQCFQSEYRPSQRLVFYSSHRPSINLLKHIQKAAINIDISNFFIMFCCAESIAEDLDVVNQLHGYDNTSMQYYSAEVESLNFTQPKFYLADNLCPLPWMHLEITTMGDIKPCCVYRGQDHDGYREGAIGSMQQHSLNEVFFGSDMTALRDDFLSGANPSGCSRCWNLESKGLGSERTAAVKRYSNQLHSSWLDQPGIRSLDIKTGNVCNFKCRMCSPVFSSAIAGENLSQTADFEKKQKLIDCNKQGRWADGNEKFINELIELLPTLENIDLLGGEPFLLKSLPVLLETAVSTGHASHIKLHANTNGSVFPKKLLPLFQHFNAIDLAISIDNIGKRFELERGGVWSEVQDNVKKITQYKSEKIHIYLFPTINIQNVLYLDELVDWADSNCLDVWFNYLDYPRELCVDNLTSTAKQLVIRKYQNHRNQDLQNLAKRVANSKGSDGKDFVRFMQHLDNVRNQNFLDSHVDIATAMGYND